MAYYYIDYTNGLDAHTGLRIPAGDYNSTSYNTIDSTADTTHFTDDALTGANDYINGSYFYNVTRSAGSLISDFDADTDTATLGTAIVGMTAGDSYYILDSYKTIAQFTSAGAARSAGDVCYIRANQTHTIAAVINCDEDGSPSSPISLIGCSSTIDPYHDASDTKVIVDFNNGAYYLYLQSDDYWYFKNIDFKNTNSSSYGMVYIGSALHPYFETCVFRDAGNSSSGRNFEFGGNAGAQLAVFLNCQFMNANVRNVYVNGYGILAVFKSCTFDSGALGTEYGFYVGSGVNGSYIYLIDCIFGGTSAHTTYDIRCDLPGAKYCCKNVTFNTANSVVGYESELNEENADGAIGENKITAYTFTSKRCASGLTDTTVRPGGGASSMKILPTSYCGGYSPVNPNYPLPLFRVWCST